MPPYDFQLSPETQKLLELINQQPQQEQLAQTEQSAQPVQQQQVEQASGTDLVNRAVESALRPQAPNVVQNKLINDVLAQKIAYNLAEQKYKAAQDEATRQGLLSDMQKFNQQANFLRDTGNKLGIDLSGYGEGVSLQDADRNLYTKELQELMHMATGRYSLSADRFYEQEFERQMMNGTSADTAHRRASRAAREYQADRVAYLNGLYNSYGRDGLVTNATGNDILLKLAADDPTAANFYAQIYPNAKNAYERQNKLEDKTLDQTNLLEKMAAMYIYNLRQADYNEQIRRGGAVFNQDLAYNGAVRNANLANELDDLAYSKKVGRARDFVNSLGLEGDAAKNMLSVIVTGKELPKSEQKKFPKEVYERMTAHYNSLNAEEKNIVSALSDENTPKEIRPALQKRWQDIQLQKQDINNVFGETLGLGSKQKVPEFTGDMDKDIPQIAELLSIMQEKGANEEEMFERIAAWAREKEPKLTDFEIQNMILTAQSNILGGAAQ